MFWAKPAIECEALCDGIGSCTAGRFSLADMSHVPDYRRLKLPSESHESEPNEELVSTGKNETENMFIEGRMIPSEQSFGNSLTSDENAGPRSELDDTVEAIREMNRGIMRLIEDDHDEHHGIEEQGIEEDQWINEDYGINEDYEIKEDHGEEEDHHGEEDHEEEEKDHHGEEEDHKEEEDHHGEEEDHHGEEEGHEEGEDHEEEGHGHGGGGHGGGNGEDMDEEHHHHHHNESETVACNNVERLWEHHCYFLTKEPVPGYRAATECSKAFPDAEFAEIKSDEANEMISEYVRELDETSGKPLHLRILYVYIKDDEEKYKEHSKRFNPIENSFKKPVCDIIGCQCVALRSTTGSWHWRICDTRHYALCRRPQQRLNEHPSTEPTVSGTFDEKESSMAARLAAAPLFVAGMTMITVMTMRLPSAVC